MYKICRKKGLKVIRIPNHNHELTFFWEDSTITDRKKMIAISGPSINYTCTDISKKQVGEVFERIFNYSLSIDPFHFEGKCVLKSDQNAQHDGRIIDCPVTRILPGMVYQQMIDNRHSLEMVKDIRVPVIGSFIPFVYYKFKKFSQRFTNEICRVEIHAAKAVLSGTELDNILAFCKYMGLDYGELDVLRDKIDGRIYIVDVNKTPWGPPFSISKSRAKFVLGKMSECFINAFLNEI